MSDASSDDRVGEVAESFLARYRRGERPSVEEYAAKYPELGDQLRQVLHAQAVLEELGPAGGAPAAPRAAAVPARLGEYRLLREVGRGGMGVVYEAVQEPLGRHVALKVLAADRRADPRTRERFRREARAAARLHHTDIVPVFGVGEHDGVAFYTMQFVHGLGLNHTSCWPCGRRSRSRTRTA
jgi:serine/threonine protein kinase